MNSNIQILRGVKVLFAAAILCGVSVSGLKAVETNAVAPKPVLPVATNSSSTAEAPIPQSAFVIPETPAEGRDPFFPKLVDQMQAATPAGKPGKTGGTSGTGAFELVLQGISGPEGRRLCVINGRSFASGEEGDIATPSGRVRLRCLEIKEELVVIEFGGERRELRFRSAK